MKLLKSKRHLMSQIYQRNCPNIIVILLITYLYYSSLYVINEPLGWWQFVQEPIDKITHEIPVRRHRKKSHENWKGTPGPWTQPQTRTKECIHHHRQYIQLQP